MALASRHGWVTGARQQVAKAHATRKLKRRVKWRGCDISVENDTGDIRRGEGWEAEMQHPYGYLRGTTGADGDHLDCFLVEGEGWEDNPVFVVHQVSQGGYYDEDKVILGASDLIEARTTYLANYDNVGPSLIGAISELNPETFEAYVKGGRENWSRPLVPQVRQKIRLQQYRQKAEKAAQDEHAEWLRGQVEVAKAGGPRDEEQSFGDFEFVAKALSEGRVECLEEVEKSDSVSLTPARRLVKITPSFEQIDLQNQLTVKDVIREAWPYFEMQGNIDLEHLTKKGGRTFEEFKEALFNEGFTLPEGMSEVAGRAFFEIGRPVRGSFNSEECSFIAEIYVGHPVADWWYHTVTEVTPAWSWRPSIAGAAKLVKVVTENPDPIFGKGMTQEIEVLRMFRWNNVGLSLEAINFYTPTVEVVSFDAGETIVAKGLSLDLEDPELKERNMKTEMTSAGEVLKSAMLEKSRGRHQ